MTRSTSPKKVMLHIIEHVLMRWTHSILIPSLYIDYSGNVSVRGQLRGQVKTRGQILASSGSSSEPNVASGGFARLGVEAMSHQIRSPEDTDESSRRNGSGAGRPVARSGRLTPEHDTDTCGVDQASSPAGGAGSRRHTRRMVSPILLLGAPRRSCWETERSAS